MDKLDLHIEAEMPEDFVDDEPVACQGCGEAFPLDIMEEHVIGNFIGFFYLCPTCEKALKSEREDPWG